MRTRHPNPVVRAIAKTRGRVMRAAATHLLPKNVMFVRGSRTGRRAALTFDDGPHALTPAYLDVLERTRTPATFFVIGRQCQAHPRELEDIVRRGHQVASHGFTHTEFPRLTGPELVDELTRTAALLPSPGGGPTRARAMVRPPRGVMTPRSLLRCYRAGYTSAMWSVDALDWDARTAEDVVAGVDVDRVEPGDIVLLHEGRATTLEALPRVIERLRQARFELVTVGDLLS